MGNQHLRFKELDAYNWGKLVMIYKSMMGICLLNLYIYIGISLVKLYIILYPILIESIYNNGRLNQ